MPGTLHPPFRGPPSPTDLLKKLVTATENITGGGGTPGGVNGQIQYNNAGNFGGLNSTGTGDVVRETAPTIDQAVLTAPDLSDAVINKFNLTGAQRITYTAMPALEINVELPGNLYSATGDVAFTFSNATPDAGKRTIVKITADGTARTITIPSTWSITRGGNITELVVAASTTLVVLFEYTGARWEIYGDPVATIGSGSSFVLGNNINFKQKTIVFNFDGGGAAITPNAQLATLWFPWAGTISSWTLLADTSGAIVVDVWVDDYASYPPTDADSITNGHEPTIAASGVKAQDLDLSDWAVGRTLTAGDTIKCNVDSCTSITNATLIMVVELTE